MPPLLPMDVAEDAVAVPLNARAPSASLPACVLATCSVPSDVAMVLGDVPFEPVAPAAEFDSGMVRGGVRAGWPARCWWAARDGGALLQPPPPPLLL